METARSPRSTCAARSRSCSGSEGEGLRPLVRRSCDLSARIPMTGELDSLSVSAAAAVALYEVARQRAHSR